MIVQQIVNGFFLYIKRFRLVNLAIQKSQFRSRSHVIHVHVALLLARPILHIYILRTNLVASRLLILFPMDANGLMQRSALFSTAALPDSISCIKQLLVVHVVAVLLFPLELSDCNKDHLEHIYMISRLDLGLNMIFASLVSCARITYIYDCIGSEQLVHC